MKTKSHAEVIRGLYGEFEESEKRATRNATNKSIEECFSAKSLFDTIASSRSAVENSSKNGDMEPDADLSTTINEIAGNISEELSAFNSATHSDKIEKLRTYAETKLSTLSETSLPNDYINLIDDIHSRLCGIFDNSDCIFVHASEATRSMSSDGLPGHYKSIKNLPASHRENELAV